MVGEVDAPYPTWASLMQEAMDEGDTFVRRVLEIQEDWISAA